MEFVFECATCGKAMAVDNPTTISAPCECGGILRAKNNVISRDDKPHLASRHVPPPTSLMGYALKLGGFDIGEKRGSERDMGRTENIHFVRDGIMRWAIASEKTEVPIQTAIRIAMRLDVKEATAIEYVRHIEQAGYFKSRNGAFAVDLSKAKKELRIENKIDLINQLQKIR
jgi:hypothetical protein